MGIKNSVFVDNSTPQCDAAFLNSVRSEINNTIANTGQTAVTSNFNQLSIAGAIYGGGGDFYTDSGAADAYVLSVIGSKSAPDAYFVGMRVRFIVGNTNTGASTVNVAGLGVKNIKARDTSSDPSAGDLTTGRIIDLTYDGTNFVVSAGVAYSADVIPTGSIFTYAGTSAPSGFLLTYGQAVSRATYADLFSLLGTSYGSGDGSTTFNLPDYRGRALIGLDNLGGASANRITDANADSLNNTGGGSETVVPTGTVGTSGATSLSTAQMPAHTHSITVNTGAGGGNVPEEGGGGSNVSGGNTGSNGSGSSHTHTGGSLTINSTNVTQPWLAGGVIIKT